MSRCPSPRLPPPDQLTISCWRSSEQNGTLLRTSRPWISSRCPATLVRLKLVRCPHLLAPTLVVLPSMSLGPPLHSLRSHTSAVMLFNASRGLSPSRSVG